MNWLEASPLSDSLKFLVEIDKLKSVLRQTCVMTGERRENSAEHSWHLAMAVMVLRPDDIDFNRALKMALIHDVVEIDAGDTFVYAIEDADKKFQEEFTAAKRIFGLLQKPEEWIQLWREFELGECRESRFVRAVDRFLPMYANALNGGYSWKHHNVSMEQIEELVKKWESDFPELARVALQLAKESLIANKTPINSP